jgi:carbamate kinase
MGPKVEAACRFIETGGTVAGIGAFGDAAEILAGRAGTIVSTSLPREPERAGNEE